MIVSQMKKSMPAEDIQKTLVTMKADFTKYDSEPTLRSGNNYGIAQLSKDKIITKNL